jgi:hypothetical protein
VTEPSSAGLFWDEDFAWDLPRRARPTDPEPPVAEPPVRSEPRRRPVRRVSPAALRAAAVLLGVVATLVLGLLVRVGESTEPTPRDASKPKSESSSPALGSPAPAPIGDPVGIGARGKEVRAVQQALSVLGFEVGTADGGFAERTRNAVVAFQQQQGVMADGVVGAETAASLRAALAERVVVDATTARKGLRRAVEAERLARETGMRYDATITRALEALESLPLAAGADIGVVLHGVASHKALYDEPRALTLFGMLAANVVEMKDRGMPAEPRDIVDVDGVVYRFSSLHGFQFHPLANFAALNSHVTKNRPDKARRLADALVARGVPTEQAVIWEYYFPYGGPSRWSSGFVQAVAADALARAGTLLGDPSLNETAKAALEGLSHRLAMEAGGGLWVREYGFTNMVILNAQLQSLVSVSRYAETSGDLDGKVIAGKLEIASRTLLSRFDTGCWSLYSLDGGLAPERYHRYHISLLRQLDATTKEPPWRGVAERWERGC